MQQNDSLDRQTGKYHESNRGYLDHWSRVGAKLEQVRRRELREHGPKPYDWRIVDSLLRLGYLHGNRNPPLPVDMIRCQKMIAAAYAKRISSGND